IIDEVTKKINKKTAEIKEDIKEEKNVETKNNFGIFEYTILIVIVALIYSLAGYFIGKRANFGTEDYSTATKEIQKFIEEYNYILENYYGDIDKDELITNAIKGMLSSLDEYSGFVGEESNNFSITLKGEYEGLGIGVV